MASSHLFFIIMIYGYTSNYVVFKEDMYYLVPINPYLKQEILRYKSLEGFEGFCPYIMKEPPSYLLDYAKHLRTTLKLGKVQEI